MKAKHLILVIALLGLIFTFGCSQNSDEKTIQSPKTQANESHPAPLKNETQVVPQLEKPIIPVSNVTENKTSTEFPRPGTKLEISPAIEKNCIGFLVGSENEIENIKLVGGGWVRPHPGPFVWGFIERMQGNYDFSYTDAYVKKAQENNISILATVWPFADWDLQDHPECKVGHSDIFYPRGGSGGLPIFRCKPNDIGLYKKFLSVLVERYDGDGVNDMPGLQVPVKYWEILNEPEMKSNELTFFIGNEQDYFEILKESYQTIKQNCSDCKVVQAGAAGSQDEFLSFWKNVFKAGGGNYFDIANIHHIGMGGTATLNVKPFKALLDEFNIKKPIWVTEAEFTDKNADVKSSVNGALNAGASKVFFVSFEVGGHGLPTPGKYAQVYKEAVGLCH